jgi:outer membrane protein assembly factor BamB
LFPIVTSWTLSLETRLVERPGYDSTRAYLPIDSGRLVAYRIADGMREWTINARPEMEPAAGGDLVFVIEGEQLVARRAADGSIAWTWPLPQQLDVRPVWDNGWLIVSTKAGSLVAMRARDGHVVWRRDLNSPLHGLPALAGDRVYAPTADGRVVALRVETGEPLWERRLGGPANEIAAGDERLYVGSRDRFLYCLMASDGRVDWRWRTGGDVIGRPVLDSRAVYFVSLDNVLRALDLVSGAQLWLRALPFRPTFGAVRAGTTVLVPGFSDTLRAYKVEDGTPAGEISVGAELTAPPRVVDDAAGVVPQIIVIGRDLVKGATVKLVSRTLEPEIKAFAPLPNALTPAALALQDANKP